MLQGEYATQPRVGRGFGLRAALPTPLRVFVPRAQVFDPNGLEDYLASVGPTGRGLLGSQ